MADALGSAHLDSVDDRVIASVPGAGLERRCLRKLDGRHLRLIRWGVHAEEKPERNKPLSGGDRPAVLLASSGHDAHCWTRALHALSQVRLDGDQPPLIFADADAAHAVHLRAVIESHALGEHVSLVPMVEARRDPVLEVDALVLPEAMHEHRSLVLDAHANGVLIAAVTDPLIDELTPEYGVTQLDPGDPERWTDELRRLFEDQRLADGRRSAGWAAVEQFHRGTTHVAAVQALYKGLLAPKSG